MMTQSIKISDQTKKRIELLQSQLLLNENLKLSQLELLEYLVDVATSDEQLIEKIKKEKQFTVRDPKTKEWEEMLNNPPDWKIQHLSKDMDEIIAKGMK